MTKICTSKSASILHTGKKFLSILIACFLISFTGYSQFEELIVDESITSGILLELDQQSDLGVIQIILDDLDMESAHEIKQEFSKYSGEIVGLGFSVVDQKLIISYRDPIYPNFLLAILDRVNLTGHYESNGEEIYYVKDGNSSFIR